MGPTKAGVKRVRPYDVRQRQERARQQHAETLRAARRLFDQNGYASTTVESIAEQAGVSAATIYKTYGGKTGLVRTLCERALEGAGPIPAEQRSDALSASSDPRTVVKGWGKLAAEVAPMIAPLLLLLRDAGSTDPEAQQLYAHFESARHTRMTHNARALAAAGGLRAGVSRTEAADVLWLASSTELYELLIVKRGWPLSRYARFIGDMLAGVLLPEEHSPTLHRS